MAPLFGTWPYTIPKGSFKGGIAILLSDRINDFVREHGVIMGGRAQFITLQWTPRLKIDIINIYTFDYTGSPTRLWNKIRQYQLPEADWIIVGDFNMVVNN